ncbi:hypothetical protein VNI00_013914 [Paramarasmius palmivorus]|uniref:Uncharacterized protein n=1 Tax=Paramarasmius palmivorus TaxID=297713 RepID=A0AAW0BY19_9AGAR
MSYPKPYGTGSSYVFRDSKTPGLTDYPCLSLKYNAVLNNAREQGGDVYGAAWIGPPDSTFSLNNQTNALTALVAAIPLRNETGGSDPNPPGPSSDNPKGSPNIGAIVGGTVGGLAFIALLVSLTLYFVRRKQRKRLMSFGASTEVAEPTQLAREAENISRVNQETKFRQTHTRTSQHPEPLPAPVTQESPNSPQSSIQLSAQTTRFGSVPTEVLVRLLNDRLQPGQWREDEELPEYASAPSQGYGSV